MFVHSKHTKVPNILKRQTTHVCLCLYISMKVTSNKKKGKWFVYQRIKGVTGEGAGVCKGGYHKSSKERWKLGRQQGYSEGDSKGKGVVSGKDLK